jgi:uncharacterized protein (AIM24 family)
VAHANYHEIVTIEARRRFVLQKIAAQHWRWGPQGGSVPPDIAIAARTRFAENGTDMPSAPKILPTNIQEGISTGIRYRLEGELVPVLHMALDGSMPVYFEHHVLLWKYPELKIGLHPLRKGLARRVFAGMPLLLLQIESGGEVAYSRDAPGHIAALHLQAGQGIQVREHQFLAATQNVEYDFTRMKGFANMIYGGGFFIDQFMCSSGVVWVHGYGNIFEKTLEAGESIDIEPGGWLYYDHSVSMSQEVYGFKTGFLSGGGSLVFNRFTGPGRVGLQSAFFHPPGAETGGGGGQAQAAGGGQGIVGGLLGGLLDN